MALSGRRGVFRRFREVIHRYEDLRRLFHAHMHRAHVADVKQWLEVEGVELELTVQELVPALSREEDETPREREPDLVDLLMLGGKVELIAGAVERHIRFEHPDEARVAFKRLAREVIGLTGRAWRKRYVKDTSEIHVDRFRLVHEGRDVRLFVETTPSVYRSFGD